MSIESDVATYIADNTDWTLGSDIWLTELPDQTKFGIMVRLIRDLSQWTDFKMCALLSIISRESSKTAREDARTVADLLNDKRGYDGNWTIVDDVSIEDFGRNELGQYLMALSFKVNY